MIAIILGNIVIRFIKLFKQLLFKWTITFYEATAPHLALSLLNCIPIN